MADEEKVHEVEVVEEPVAVQRGSASLASGLSELATREDAVALIERAAQSLISLRRASIAATNPHDWTLYKADDRVTGYLESLACWNLRPLWGVDTIEPTEPYKIEHEDGTFAWAIDGSGYCNTTKTSISKVTGICYSNEDFLIHRKLPPIKLEPQMKLTARQRLEGILVREAGGLKRVPIEELDDVWKGTWKRSGLCPHGRGFGTADQRAGGAAAHGIDQADIPECDVCRIQLVWRPGKDGKEGFFGCRNWDKHKETKVIVSLSQAKKIAETKHKREPGEEP